MNIQQIDAEFQDKYFQLEAELGHRPSFDEQLELSAWYHGMVTDMNHVRDRVQHQVELEEINKAKGDRYCEKCGEVIPPTGKRGRPRKVHEECQREGLTVGDAVGKLVEELQVRLTEG